MTKQYILNEIDEIYKKRQTSALLDLYEKEQVALENPEFKSLDSEYRNAVIDCAKGLISSSEFTQIENSYKSIKQKLELYPTYFCAKCNDTGTLESGKNCECFKKLLGEVAHSITNNQTLPKFNFKDNSNPDKDLEKLYSVFERFVENFPESNNNLVVLTGKTAVGKTCLMASTANALLDKGFYVKWLTAYEFGQICFNFHSKKSFSDRKNFEELLECDILMIDDLGTETFLNNVTEHYLYLAISERINHNKHMFFTTNLTQDEVFDRYGDRIYSRMTAKNNAKWFKLSGEDLRRK